MDITNEVVRIYVAERLREFRKESKMTIEEVAEQVGIAKGTLGQYERNEREIGIGTMFHLARIYKRHISEFFPTLFYTSAERFNLDDLYPVPDIGGEVIDVRLFYKDKELTEKKKAKLRQMIPLLLED